MNDSFGRISSPAPTSGNNARGGLVVQILKLPNALQNNTKAVRLEGQITQLNNNGSIRISTQAGDIEVRVRGNRQPQNGQSIEIELPAGRPPKQGNIRDISAQVSRENTATRSNASLNTVPPNVPRTNLTDPQITSPVPNQRVEASVSRPITSLPPVIQESVSQTLNTNNSTIQTRPLTANAVVRLLSVSPAQAQTIATEYAQQLPQPQINTVLKTAFSANLISQNTQNQLATPLLQTPQIQIPPSTPTQQNLLQPHPLSQPIIGNTVLQSPVIIPPSTPPLATPTAILRPPVTTQIIPATQTLPTNNAIQILGAQAQTPIGAPSVTLPQNATITPAPLNFNPTNPVTTLSSRVATIDIQIVQITPPPTNIVTATTTLSQTNILPAATQFTPPVISTNTAPTITAQVTGFTPQGLPLITAQLPGTPLPQSFILQFNSNNLQLGSQLQIIPKTSTAPVAPLVTPQPPALTSLLQGFQFPALDDLYNSLLKISPQAAASLTRSLPNAGNPSQLSPAAMIFIAAVKSGNIASFLGDKKIDLIQRTTGGADILSKLTQRPAGAAATTVDPVSAGEWRAVPLPMFWEGEIHRITLYTRNEQQQKQQDNEGHNQTRFIFDLSLSRMGDVQLDGLLRDKRLDLVVRSQNAFSEPMQQTMRQAYTTALGYTDLSGELNFQGSTKNWVHVLEQKEQLGVHV